ncbi:MAG: bifunctional UDP-N-acetylmuramoyl-tripeptide:D-alanyl-D-alanine ligase/alanine racemase, partial [Bacteroidota bacterium]
MQLKAIQKITNAKWLCAANKNAQVGHLLIDSRQLNFPASTLFFAFNGQRHNGHDYIEPLYRAGVRHFMVCEPFDIQPFPDANILLVENMYRALQQMAEVHRTKFQFPVIAITGSNGKTIVKEWLFQLLHQDHNIVRSPRSYNSQIGVPLSIWLMEPTHNLAIIEAGISRKGEMQKLAPMIAATLGIFTNIGPAHDEGFANMAEKIDEKLQLFSSCDTIIYCRDDQRVQRAMRRWKEKVLFTWSVKGKANLTIKNIDKRNNQKTFIEAIYKGQRQRILIPFADDASIENAIHCWCVLLQFGLSPDQIKDRMRGLEPVAMRLELKAGINNCTIINDSYNSDLTSLELALNFASQQTQQQKLTLLLSDILQTGQEANRLYKQVAGLLKEKGVNRLIGIGTSVAQLQQYLPEKMRQQYFSDTDRFLALLDFRQFQNETILLKGARKFGFERIANKLSQKVHKTVLEVNLNALIHNLRAFSRRLESGTRVMAMVKASAYGSGSVEVARLLEFHQVDYLTVAYADEGVELREAGIQLPILVLNPEEASFDAIISYQLEPEIYNLSLLKRFLNFLGKDRPARLHLKIDTGMHRLGFEASDISELVQLIKPFKRIKIISVFSHLAASDAPEHDRFTKRQVRQFINIADQIDALLGYRPLRHICNSSGIVRFPQYQMDMVRLGIGLYGIDALIQSELQVVNTLKATISQIKKVKARQTVGYNRSGRMDRSRRIATISIGYADGLPRATSNGNYAVYLHQQRAPIVGNVCMDMCMIDVSDIPEAMEGDEVEIFGRHLPVEQLAKQLNTIPYEIFTGIS